MVVTHNNATADGGGLVMFNMTQGSWTLTVNNSVISDDHAGDAGGGIDTDGAGTVFINNSQITGNTDINQGAGVYIDVAAGSSAPDGAVATAAGPDEPRPKTTRSLPDSVTDGDVLEDDAARTATGVL